MEDHTALSEERIAQIRKVIRVCNEEMKDESPGTVAVLKMATIGTCSGIFWSNIVKKEGKDTGKNWFPIRGLGTDQVLSISVKNPDDVAVTLKLMCLTPKNAKEGIEMNRWTVEAGDTMVTVPIEGDLLTVINSAQSYFIDSTSATTEVRVLGNILREEEKWKVIQSQRQFYNLRGDIFNEVGLDMLSYRAEL